MIIQSAVNQIVEIVRLLNDPTRNFPNPSSLVTSVLVKNTVHLFTRNLTKAVNATKADKNLRKSSGLFIRCYLTKKYKLSDVAIVELICIRLIVTSERRKMYPHHPKQQINRSFI